MSECSVAFALERISSADPSSPLAVWDLGENDRVDVVFANTAVTRARLRHSTGLIGIFDNEMNLEEVKKRIYSRLRTEAAAGTEKRPRGRPRKNPEAEPKPKPKPKIEDQPVSEPRRTVLHLPKRNRDGL